MPCSLKALHATLVITLLGWFMQIARSPLLILLSHLYSLSSFSSCLCLIFTPLSLSCFCRLHCSSLSLTRFIFNTVMTEHSFSSLIHTSCQERLFSLMLGMFHQYLPVATTTPLRLASPFVFPRSSFLCIPYLISSPSTSFVLFYTR